MSDWYQEMLDAWAGTGAPPFCTDTPSGRIETSMILGGTWTDATGRIRDWTATGGLLETLEAVLTVEVAYEDRSKTSGTVYNSRTSTVILTKPLSEWAVISNTCPAPSGAGSCETGNEGLQLYACWNVEAAVPSTFSNSPTSGAFTSVMVTKAIQNLSLRRIAGVGTLTCVDSGEQMVLETGLLTTLTPNTNCFPGNVANYGGCLPADDTGSPHWVDTRVWAFGSAQSTTIPCVSAFTGTTCTKAYHNEMPLRLLVAAERTEDATWSPTNETWTVNPTGPEHMYMRLVHATGGLIPSRSASWPFPRSDSTAVRGKTMPTGLIVALAIAGIVLVGVGITAIMLAQHAHHIVHARSKLFAHGLGDALESTRGAH